LPSRPPPAHDPPPAYGDLLPGYANVVTPASASLAGSSPAPLGRALRDAPGDPLGGVYGLPLVQPPPLAIVVRRPGRSIPLELDLDADTSIQQLKDIVPDSFRGVSADAVHLIHAGKVLIDTARLSELALEEIATFWLIVGRPAPGAAERLALYENVTSLGIFPLGRSGPNKLQTDFVAKCASSLRTYADTLVADDALWRPEANELAAFSNAIAALERTAPAFNAAPHVTWLGEYGCALLASEPSVGKVHLRVVALDAWSFRMHSSTVRTHTADSRLDACVIDHVGHVLHDEYVEFMCALMNRIRAQRPALT
jgi:hypothetical protein